MNQFKNIITPKTKVTVFFINGIAATSKIEVTVQGKTDNYGYYGNLKKTRKKVHFLPKNQKHIVFNSWELPIKADSETNEFMGNACINILGESKEFVKEFIENNCLNILDDTLKSRINYVEVTPEFQENIYTPLF